MEQAEKNLKSFVLQNTKTQMTSPDNAPAVTPEKGMSWNTNLTGSALAMLPDAEAGKLQVYGLRGLVADHAGAQGRLHDRGDGLGRSFRFGRKTSSERHGLM